SSSDKPPQARRTCAPSAAEISAGNVVPPNDGGRRQFVSSFGDRALGMREKDGLIFFFWELPLASKQI
ncbi:MAG: hypothetical protein II150_04875, partial [Thermoguttaceae bacterium]|nr:hypothetical protein [Thermoguttaceae bacterium]